MKYTFQFMGRLIGALGIKTIHTVTVDADTEEAARLKLYDTHEHIGPIFSVKVKTDS